MTLGGSCCIREQGLQYLGSHAMRHGPLEVMKNSHH